jgi:hypothetical protein
VILYNPPERMQVGVANRVEVRISRKLSDELSKGLRGEGAPRIEHLRVGTLMKAKLEGTAFDIAPIGSDVQELPATGYREWRWNVTPTDPGSQSLFFTVSVLYEDKALEENVLERRIDVAVNPVYSVSKWLSDNWVPLITVLGVVAGIAETIRRLGRKQQAKE